MPNLRALPRAFVPGVSAEGPFELPPDELDKFRKVLRLGTGDLVAILPDDGTLITCRLQGRQAVPESVEPVETEPDLRVVLAQAFPKGDRLETVLRMGTEVGVSEFWLFPAERSVVRWDAHKLADKVRRLEAIVRESAEQSYRGRLPKISLFGSLREVLEEEPDALVLSEVETVTRRLRQVAEGRPQAVLVVGPEGGWAPAELGLIGDRGVTLGPRVLRTDSAGPAAAAVLLLG